MMGTAAPAGREFDVVVIGAGTAGLAAAKAAHQAGARVAVVDHGPLGTLCARRGCMPSKLVLRSAEVLAQAHRAPVFGVDCGGPPRFDWPAARARTQTLVADFVGYVVRATETSSRFTLLHGRAEFLDGTRVRVDGGDSSPQVLGAAAWVVATGSEPVVPPIPGLDRIPYLVSDDVFALETIPSSVAVIGAGAIGVELGQFLARAGADVHLIESGASVAGLSPGPLLDAFVAPLTRELALYRETAVAAVRQDGSGTVLALRGAPRTELRVARVLVAAGRRPHLAGLHLERAGVRVQDGIPVHDAQLRTSNPAVFVAGDAAGPPALLHTASLQGRAAGHNAARPDAAQIPRIEPLLTVVFSDPAIATVGLDPAAAARAGRQPCVARRAWAEQGKARIIGRTDGIAQLVVDRATREVVGCQLVGPHADLLIHLLAYALHFRATVDDLLALHHYHPTLAEMIPSLAHGIVAELDRRHCLEAEVAPGLEMQ